MDDFPTYNLSDFKINDYILFTINRNLKKNALTVNRLASIVFLITIFGTAYRWRNASNISELLRKLYWIHKI